MKLLIILLFPLSLFAQQQQASYIFKATTDTTFGWINPLALPISTATQTALNLKANLISPSFTTPVLGTPTSGNLANCTFPTLNQNTSGSAASLSADIPQSRVTNLVSDLAGKQATITAGSITNTQLAGSIDLSTKVTGLLPFANTGGATAATSATTGTISVSMVTPIITCTPTGALTLNATGGVTGQRITFVVTTSGASSFVLTFGTNFKSTATLATGVTTAKTFCVSFICTNGTTWAETSRTAAM